jgi:hypothetical protein
MTADAACCAARSGLPGPIDNDAVLCAHGALDPQRPSLVKRVSAAAWQALQARYGCVRELRGGDAVCRACVASTAAAASAAADAGARRDEARAAVAALDAAGWPEPTAVAATSAPHFWVSRTWLSKWCSAAHRATAGAPPPAASVAAFFAPVAAAAPSALLAAGPTASIVCPHGALAPQSGPRRAVLPAPLWAFVREDAARIARDAATAAAAAHARAAAKEAAKAPAKRDDAARDDDGAQINLCEDTPPKAEPLAPPPVDDDPMEADADAGAVVELRCGAVQECAACASGNAGSRDAARAQKEGLAALARGAATPLLPGAALRLLPAPWLAAWRSFVGANGRAGGPQPPGALADALEALAPRCHHGQLPSRLPQLAQVRGKWQVRDGDAASAAASGGVPMALVSDEDFAQLQVFYGEAPAAAAVRVVAGAGAAAAPTLASEPPVCEACVAAREAAAREAAARFIEKDITVELKYASREGPPAEGDEAADGAANGDAKPAAAGGDADAAAAVAAAAAASAAAAAASAAAAAPGARRTSARARRGHGGGQQALKVSASDTVRELKLRILEAFGVHPCDQTLFLAGAPLGEDSTTLGAAGVVPGARLFCAAGAEHDPDDVASLLAYGAPASGRDAPERGFSGTGLLGGGAHGAGPGSPGDVVIMS